MKLKRRHLPDPNYMVVVGQDKFDHSVDFKIFPAWETTTIATGRVELNYQKSGAHFSPDPIVDIEDAEVFLEGFLKWDGCINYRFPTQDQCMLHGCGSETGADLKEVFDTIYRLAQELIPKFDWEELRGD